MKTETILKSLDLSVELVEPEPERPAQANPMPTPASAQQPPKSRLSFMLPEHSGFGGYLHWGLNE